MRDWFRREAEALGAIVTVDEVGNMFALRPGRMRNLAPIALGSHLENLERNDGFKGFNQQGVSDIIARTDPRRQLHTIATGDRHDGGEQA